MRLPTALGCLEFFTVWLIGSNGADDCCAVCAKLSFAEFFRIPLIVTAVVLLLVVVDVNVYCHVVCGIPFIVKAIVLIIFVDVNVSCHIGFCMPLIVVFVFQIIIVVDVYVHCHIGYCIPFIVDVVILIVMVTGAHVRRLGLS